MSATQISGGAKSGPSRCYLYWRSPSGFWTRRVACERSDSVVIRENRPLAWTRSAAGRHAVWARNEPHQPVASRSK